MVKTEIKIFIKKDLDDEDNIYIEYIIKVSRDFIERFSSDGDYYTFNNKESLEKGLNNLKKLYPNHKVIDKTE
jgi:hypothetical protein